MKLYLLKQNKLKGYDIYDEAVVAAGTTSKAKLIHPDGKKWDGKLADCLPEWPAKEGVKATYIGQAKRGTKPGVICASFNAG